MEFHGSSKFFVEILTTECSETPSAALKAAMEIHVFEISAAMDPRDDWWGIRSFSRDANAAIRSFFRDATCGDPVNLIL